MSNTGDGTLMRRRIRIYLPENYQPNQPAPLIIAFHGKGRPGSTFELVTTFSKREHNRNAIVVYPDGIGIDVGEMLGGDSLCNTNKACS